MLPHSLRAESIKTRLTHQCYLVDLSQNYFLEPSPSSLSEMSIYSTGRSKSKNSSPTGSLYEMDRMVDTNVSALDEIRQSALSRIDQAPFSRTHVKVALVAGTGFFTDAYDIFAINIASTMLGYVYGGPGQQLSPHLDLGVKAATPIGNIFGQFLFGWLADIVGRKRMYGVELMIIIVSTFTQALAGQARAVNILEMVLTSMFTIA